jgi:nickel transport protein
MKKFLFFFLFLSGIIFAHKINIFTYKEGNKIFVEGYFQDGSPTKNAVIEIYNEKAEKIIEGKTDLEGIFSFDIPDAKKIKVVLNADMGHRAETEMELQKEEKKELKKEGTETQKENKRIEKVEIQKNFDEEIIKKIVEESVEKAINPVLKEIEKEKQKTRIFDIIGGIGYIFGILGIYLYFKEKLDEWKK